MRRAIVAWEDCVCSAAAQPSLAAARMRVEPPYGSGTDGMGTGWISPPEAAMRPGRAAIYALPARYDPQWASRPSKRRATGGARLSHRRSRPSGGAGPARHGASDALLARPHGARVPAALPAAPGGRMVGIGGPRRPGCPCRPGGPAPGCLTGRSRGTPEIPCEARGECPTRSGGASEGTVRHPPRVMYLVRRQGCGTVGSVAGRACSLFAEDIRWANGSPTASS